MVVQKKFNDCMVQIDSESKFQLKCTSKSVGQNERTAFTSTTYIGANHLRELHVCDMNPLLPIPSPTTTNHYTYGLVRYFMCATEGLLS